ncbi:DUF2530 domain-containing protein [Cellulomonas fimi]|uniref:DUF2530 domain-containing protein n=1 Tax=Cellulomonas fimi TaxID=1708 RepID=A0A7Y0M229_CELFI|nr:DUF2530 domain-containing protein [Cellulomonas fimi]NMR21022.1 DUF2530 domain-containing protein [Cellulomonas fimi]
MPSVLDLVLHPDRRRPDPAPVRVDLRIVFSAGLAAWVVALVVTWALARGDGNGPTEAVWTCVAGVGLGVVALVWEHYRRPEDLDLPGVVDRPADVDLPGPAA